MIGKRPYVGRNRKEIRDQIVAKQVQIRRNEIPDDWSLEAADFINKLIQRKPANRIGNDGPEELKSHAWFKNYPWEKLLKKEIPSPFIPNEEEVEQKQSQANHAWDDEDAELVKQNAIMLRRNSVQGLFNGYNFDQVCATPTTTASSSNSPSPHLKQTLAHQYSYGSNNNSFAQTTLLSPVSVEHRH